LHTIVKIYIDFLYDELGKDVAESLLSIPPGVKLLKNGVQNLFEHPHVILWHKFLLELFDPRICGKPYAVIMPCSSIKPYRLSPTHRILDSTLSQNNVEQYVQVYILSEPMILVPRELDIYYPFSNYEYPPGELLFQYRKQFVDVLSSLIPKLEYHRKIVVVLPRHHLSIFLDAVKKSSSALDYTIINYGKKAFQSIKKAANTVVSYINS